VIATGARFSPCRRYRYTLNREWEPTLPTVIFCGLNPSTADETQDDPTIRREIGFAMAWGFGKLIKVNAYGFRSTDPKALWKVDDPRGPDNFLEIKSACFQTLIRRGGGLFVAAWGNNIRTSDAVELRRMLRLEGVKVHAIRITKLGNPAHPLYLPKTLRPFPWPEVRPCDA